jgi:hypothetical protein
MCMHVCMCVDGMHAVHGCMNVCMSWMRAYVACGKVCMLCMNGMYTVHVCMDVWMCACMYVCMCMHAWSINI